MSEPDWREHEHGATTDGYTPAGANPFERVAEKLDKFEAEWSQEDITDALEKAKQKYE